LAESKPHKAKPTRKNRKFGRNRLKCAAYRRRVGKPRGPGVEGNKRGKGRFGGPSATASSRSLRRMPWRVLPAPRLERCLRTKRVRAIKPNPLAVSIVRRHGR